MKLQRIQIFKEFPVLLSSTVTIWCQNCLHWHIISLWDLVWPLSFSQKSSDKCHPQHLCIPTSERRMTKRHRQLPEANMRDDRTKSRLFPLLSSWICEQTAEVRTISTASCKEGGQGPLFIFNNENNALSSQSVPKMSILLLK